MRVRDRENWRIEETAHRIRRHQTRCDAEQHPDYDAKHQQIRRTTPRPQTLSAHIVAKVTPPIIGG